MSISHHPCFFLFFNIFFFFFFNDTATTEIYTLSLHDALPILFGGLKLALHQEPHGDRRRMPAARGQPAEHGAGGRFVVEMKRLRIEFGGKGLDPLRVNRRPAGAVRLPGREVLEVSPTQCAGPSAPTTTRRNGQAIRPNQAPPATAAALTRPKAASASPSARNTPVVPSDRCKAINPPPTAIASRKIAATSAHRRRPAPCDAK